MLTAHETTFWLLQREGRVRDAARSLRGRVAMSDKPAGLISSIRSTKAHKRFAAATSRKPKPAIRCRTTYNADKSRKSPGALHGRVCSTRFDPTAGTREPC